MEKEIEKSEKEEKEVEKDVEENKQKEEKDTKWRDGTPTVVIHFGAKWGKLQTHFI